MIGRRLNRDDRGAHLARFGKTARIMPSSGKVKQAVLEMTWNFLLSGVESTRAIRSSFAFTWDDYENYSE